MSDKHTLYRADTQPPAKRLLEAMTSKQKPDIAQLFFNASVLDTYRERDGFRIIRTDTSGRLSKPGGWSVDFGISGEGDRYIHIPAHAWVHRIPVEEQAHWLEYALTLPLSDNFVRGVVRPGCIDDGPIRNW
ncbi:hypothetical protein SD51_05960 [Alicyclobacillus tengchongensis]|nr:hypothetical protein SD51_05960 [Alicyclobacillus tengchongensis]